MEEIKNEKISISTSSYSAELCSVKNVVTGEELMWQADPKYWGRHCPMLFPTVGAVWEGRYLHRGVWRNMPKHGFMQQREFELREQTADSVTYFAHDNHDTRLIYPFEFELEQKFRLEGSVVHVEWTVRSEGSDDMPFQIGGHPSFFFRGWKPGQDVKGYLQFDIPSPESATVGCEGCLGAERYRLNAPDGVMEVHDADFQVDSIIIDHSQVHSITLMDTERRPVVRVSSQAPVFLVWSPYGIEAPFVCLEPWYGLCDAEGYNGEFIDRPYTNIAPAGGEWKGGYDIEVL